MNGLGGCYILVGIVVFIILLSLWSRKSRQGVREFYGKYSLTLAESPPANVREAIGVKDPMCLQGSVTANSGDTVPFYWWEWSSRSMISTGNSVQSSISCFLAISFPPNTVSRKFQEIAIGEKDAKRDVLKKVKDIYALNTHKPIRIEKLSDGSFVIFWQIVQRPAVMEDKIAWLKQNLSAPKNSITTDVTEANPETTVSSEPGPGFLTFAKATFYKHDDYASIQRTFKTAWPKLDLELNHDTPRFQHEGRDELTPETRIFGPNEPDGVILELNDDTIAGTAADLFSKRLNVVAFILRNGYSVEDRETLANCNDPFMLPLNKYSYREFKRRFKEHWPELEIELYDVSPDHGSLSRGTVELPDDFEMSTLSVCGDPLNDYIYP